jgi:hypothetical protein
MKSLRTQLSTTSTPALSSNKPPIQMAPAAICSEMKALGREAHHSVPSSSQVKNGGDIPPIPHTPSRNIAWLFNLWQGNFTLLTNPVALVRERTIQTERPPLVREVSANFCRLRGVAWSVRQIPYSRNIGFLDLTSLVHYHKVLH